MRVVRWVICRDRPSSFRARTTAARRRALKPSPTGRGNRRFGLTDAKLIYDWTGLLIEAVEALGPQRLEVDGKASVTVVPLDTCRRLIRERPSFVETIRSFGRPDSEVPGEQAPFNVTGCPVPAKY